MKQELRVVNHANQCARRTTANIVRVSELICPNSPDLNPVDYSIWGYLQQLVYRQKIRNIQHLKEVIVNCWSDISQQFIDGAIDQWSSRIAAVVSARGKHIEYSVD